MSSDEQLHQDTPETVLLDRAGVIVAVNQAWLDYARYNGGDPARTGIGVSYLDACDAASHDPAARQVASAVRAAIRGDLPAQLRIRIPCHPPDAERWFDVFVSSRRDDWGDCLGATVTLAVADPPPPIVRGAIGPAREPGLDLTTALRAFDLLADPVFVLDVGLRVVAANRAAISLLGYSEQELAHLVWADLDQASDLLTAPTLVWEPGSRARERLVHCKLNRRDGVRIPVEARVRRTEPGGTDGPVLTSSLVTVVARDLRGRATAGETVEPYRVAFEGAPIGMALIRIDESGARTVLSANQALADLFGDGMEQLVGSDLDVYSTPDNLAHDRQTVAALLSGTLRAYSRHKCYVRADGRRVWTEVRMSRIDVPEIDGVTVLAHFVDVTERHEAEQRRARQAELDAAVAEIATIVLAGTSLSAVYRLVTEVTARVFEAENVVLGMPDVRSGRLTPVAALGTATTELLARGLPGVPGPPVGPTNGPAAEAPDEATNGPAGGPANGPAAEAPDEATNGPAANGAGRPAQSEALGPVATVRFGPPEPDGGLLAVARGHGDDPFGEADLALLVMLAQQVALAVELGRARADRQRLAVLEDRQRIARDLHDTVIQDLIAVGMRLDAAAAREASTDPRRARSDAELVDQLEEAVRRLRSSVFQLRSPDSRLPLPDAVSAVAVEASRVLGHLPSVRMAGEVETVPEPAADAIVAVLREGLSNVARHAGAHATDVELTLDRGHVRLVVTDDGIGLPTALVPGDGIANIRHRAEALHGGASVAPGPKGGTRLTWSCPLRTLL